MPIEISTGKNNYISFIILLNNKNVLMIIAYVILITYRNGLSKCLLISLYFLGAPLEFQNALEFQNMRTMNIHREKHDHPSQYANKGKPATQCHLNGNPRQITRRETN